MSRIGNKVIQVPAGVTVTVSPENYAVVKGPKAQLEFQFNQSLGIKVEGSTVTVTRPNDEIFSRKIHGTTRALLANMVNGVSVGFKKQLEIRGVGYRAALQGNVVNLSLGFSHPIDLEIPAGITVTFQKTLMSSSKVPTNKQSANLLQKSEVLENLNHILEKVFAMLMSMFHVKLGRLLSKGGHHDDQKNI